MPAAATSFSNQKLLIDAAIEAGVKLFFASEFVGNILGAYYQLFPKQWVGEKVAVRRYLEEKAKEGQICWTALNGGPFFDMCMFSFLSFGGSCKALYVKITSKSLAYILVLTCNQGSFAALQASTSPHEKQRSTARATTSPAGRPYLSYPAPL